MRYQTKQKGSKKRFLSGVILMWVAAVVAIIALVTIVLNFVQPPPPKEITIASGSQGGAYYSFAREYQELLKKEGLNCKILETSGSIENLRLLTSGKVEIAFLQSGITSSQDNANSELRALASIYYEPLWVFYRGSEDLNLLNQLQGKHLGIGGENSGTKAVSLKLLELNGLSPENTHFHTLSITETSEKLLNGELDAAFLITSPKAASFRRLLENDQIKVMNFRRYQAYARNFLFVKEVLISEGMLDIRRNMPEQDITLLSTLATLVTTDKLHPQIVEIVLACARRIHSGEGLLEKSNEFPASNYLEFPLHEAAANYFYSGPSFLAKYLPFWLITIIRRLAILIIPLITLLFPLFKITPLAIRWPVKRKLNKWYIELEKIEYAVKEYDTHDDLEKIKSELKRLEEGVEEDPLPPSYKNESFQLRFHIRHVFEEINEHLNKSN